MIELPRACFRADQIAAHADFFSFGTNDLTQTALGFSRDDIEARILARYLDVEDPRPLAVRDDRLSPASGRCSAWARGSGARRSPTSSSAICGEHGGDPDSIDFFHHSGIDYVSCSPFRVPDRAGGRGAGGDPGPDARAVQGAQDA